MSDAAESFRVDRFARRRENDASEIAANALMIGGAATVLAIAAVYSPQVIARASVKLRAIEILLDGCFKSMANDEKEVEG